MALQGGVFRTSCPPDAEWVASPWDPVGPGEAFAGRRLQSDESEASPCLEPSVLLGQQRSLYKSRAARTGRCLCPQMLTCHYLQQCLDITTTPRSFVDLPMQLSLNPNPAPMGAKAVFSRLCGSCCDTSADPPRGAPTRQHLAACAGTGVGGPSRPWGPFSIPGSTCPGRAGWPGPGGRFPAELLLVSRSRHRQHFGCDRRWLLVAWRGPVCRCSPGPRPVPASHVLRASAATLLPAPGPRAQHPRLSQPGGNTGRQPSL